jgi:Fur family ferric uptake transcriptional regulator
MKRKTNQRNAIQEVFRNIDRPLDIYRNLKILVEKGWLKKIYTPGRGALYERAGKEHHHHFQCRQCDRLFEIAGCAFNEQSSTPPGFITEEHEVYLYGICSSCRD